MDAVAAVLLACAALYAAVGLIFAVAFVISGVTIVQNAPVTVGARILIFPAAAALWPLVFARWRHSRARP